jgi:Fic family protein
MLLNSHHNMRRIYIWALPDWPRFRWDSERLLRALQDAHLKQGRLLGQMERLGFDLRIKAELRAVAEEALKSSEIEGESLNIESVRSSVARRLGVSEAALGPVDRSADGIVQMLLDATKHYAAPLTRERLFGWQAALFPTGYSGLERIKVGAWRDGPIYVRSEGKHGRIHFEGPPAERIEAEMKRFLDWFNEAKALDGIVEAGIAHLWFCTIHPFDDGNGRIARALADLCLARSEQSEQRFYSLSAQIRHDRSVYYDSLESTQKGSLDATEQLVWFTGCFSRALDHAREACAKVLAKAEFWQAHAQAALNERQRKVLNRVLDGFEGNLTARKWTAITRCSMATAQRDIADLIARKVLIRNPGGSKNSNYSIAGSDTPTASIST